MYNNRIIKDQLPLHQLIEGDINIPYKNIGALFDSKLQETPDKIFLICPGKRKDIFTYKNFREKFLQVAEKI